MTDPPKMERLSDFKPLRRLALPDLGDLECSGLILLVGPNSSGKSQLLQDIYRRIAGEPRKLVVAESIEIDKPPFEPFVQCLESEGYFSTIEDETGQKHFRPQTMYLGMGQAVGQIPFNDAQRWYGSFSPDSLVAARRNSEFLNYFGRLLVTALFLDRRLTSLSATGVIDFLTQSPQHDLHALYLDERAQGLLHEEMVRSFGRAAWPDMSRGNQVSLKVSDEGVLPTSADRLSYKKMAAFRSIETEGDGLKSYVATCVALLLGQRPVCVIDEPELCLHPPQAYNLGRFIGRFGSSPDTATFVATHSSHLLRGVIQTTQRLQIVRLTRRQGKFSAHLVNAASLTEALARPTLRAETVLDGIFSQAVVVVEADGDRALYQAAWETISSEFLMDLHFSAVGGTGGIADTCRLYRTLRIPIAVIADLDALMDSDKIARILTALVDDEHSRRQLSDRARKVADSIAKLPPTVLPADVKRQLQALVGADMNWSLGHDSTLRRQLRQLSNDLDRMRRLKAGGVSAFEEPTKTELSSLVADLAAEGLYLVPVGELEEWLSGHDVGVSKSDKRAWSNAAAQYVQKAGRQDGDVWAFVHRVASHLAAAAAALRPAAPQPAA